jgi:hypothetical protein
MHLPVCRKLKIEFFRSTQRRQLFSNLLLRPSNYHVVCRKIKLTRCLLVSIIISGYHSTIVYNIQSLNYVHNKNNREIGKNRTVKSVLASIRV